MKWSDYYKGLYSRVQSLPEMQGKAFYLRGANILINASLAVEDGRITREQFDSFRREMIAAESEYIEQTKAQNAAAQAQAAALYNDYLQAKALEAIAWRAATPSPQVRPTQCRSYRSGNEVVTDCW